VTAPSELPYNRLSSMRPTPRERPIIAVAFTAALVVCLVPSVSVGEAAQDGVALFSQARFDEAAAAFEAVLNDPEASAVQIATAHLHMAALRLIAGDERGAERHASAAVALNPSASAPDGAPLRLEELLREAASAEPEGGLSVTVEVPSCPAAGAPVHTSARVTGAPQGLVASTALRCSCGEASQEAEVTDAPTVSLVLQTGTASPGDELTCEASARSQSGAVLRSRRVRVALCRPSSESTTSADTATSTATEQGEPEHRSRRGLWIGVGVGATVAVAVAVTLGVVLGTRSDMAELGQVELGGP